MVISEIDINWLCAAMYMPFEIDVNECATLNGSCSQMCVNTIGSYLCSCGYGYELDLDNRTCNGKFKCINMVS